MTISLKQLGLALGATLALSSVTFGQAQTAPAGVSPDEQVESRRGGEGKRGGMHGLRRHHRAANLRRYFKTLNLTDAQKAQMRSIAVATKEATKTRREELFRLREARQPGVEMSAESKARRQELRAEIRRAAEGARAQMLNVLTPEQRTQIEQLKQERGQRRAERRARFGSNDATQNQ